MSRRRTRSRPPAASPFAVALLVLLLRYHSSVTESFALVRRHHLRSSSTQQRNTECAGPRASSSSPSSRRYYNSAGRAGEDLYAAVHRKEHEMKQVKQQHRSTADPVNMALGYAEETSGGPLRLARALRRVHDDPHNPANPHYCVPAEEATKSPRQTQRDEQLRALGMQELGMRRGSFVVDIKRNSLSNPPGAPPYCQFDDAGQVAEAMVRLGADAVLVSTDYRAYGGDLSELKSAVRRVRAASDTAAVVMKDIVVDEIQLGLAKEAGADGIVLQAAVLGAALENFLDLATTIGLETVVECHTKNEVERALEILAPNILVHNYDRIQQKLYPEQAIQLAGLFPGSGGPIICLAGGGIDTVEKMKKHLAVGYDGVVVGKAVMGSPKAPEFIRAVRDRTLLPAEMAQWGIEAEFDMDGEIMSGPRSDIPSTDDPKAYQ